MPVYSLPMAPTSSLLQPGLMTLAWHGPPPSARSLLQSDVMAPSGSSSQSSIMAPAWYGLPPSAHSLLQSDVMAPSGSPSQSGIMASNLSVRWQPTLCQGLIDPVSFFT